MLAAAVDRDDVRVVERGGEPGVGLEARDRAGVLGVLRRDDLQRETAVEIRIARPAYDPDPAAIEHSLDAVSGKGSARFQIGERRCGTIADVSHDGTLAGRSALPSEAVRRPLREYQRVGQHGDGLQVAGTVAAPRHPGERAARDPG